jgi:hypothetical protein
MPAKNSRRPEKNKVNTLALGMTWPSKRVLHRLIRNGETTTQTRDCERLTQLQQGGEYKVVGMACETPVEMSAQKFILGSFSRRGARTVAEWCGTDKKSNRRQIKFVFCDFFRFPGPYMDTAYSDLGAFMGQLDKLGVLHDDYVLFAPNRESILRQFPRGQYNTFFAKADENPLYNATLELQKRNPNALHGYKVQRQLDFTKSVYPFIKVSAFLFPRAQEK